MARADGSNVAVSWIARVLCVGVIGALLWFATPMMPGFAAFVGETLRIVAPASP
ncbi:hypothetical protein LG322_02955 [Microbacterium aerolatum]|uniref:hypothetical protein n=1 Tax=Microbacterium aerolatum TaxID=153731 RepID=UPI001649AFAC|nr:hypothetical protein [Microbacterium aerolatum]MCK3768543.1 hypothetical protein [Microbacterium aerolatum]